MWGWIGETLIINKILSVFHIGSPWTVMNKFWVIVVYYFKYIIARGKIWKLLLFSSTQYLCVAEGRY
jgi:hypothetical protein